MAQATEHFSVLDAAIRSGKVTVLPTAVGEPVQNPQTLPPDFEFKMVGATDTHILVAASLSFKMMEDNQRLFAFLMNCSTARS
jgi:hypothetical protein